MKTDKLFYALFKQLPASFFELIGRAAREANAYRPMTSVEIKELAFRIDAVFIPKRTSDVFYFVEVQFQRDEDFYARLFAEIFLYLRQHPEHKQWQAAVIYPSRAVEPTETSAYRELLESKRVIRIYLDEVVWTKPASALKLVQLVTEPVATAPQLAKALISQPKLSRKFLELIEQILAQKFQNLTREEIQKMLKLDKALFRDTRVYQEFIEEGVQEGLEKGIEKGIEKGLKQGAAKTVAEIEAIAKRLLAKQVSIEIVAETTGLSKAKLRRLMPRRLMPKSGKR